MNRRKFLKAIGLGCLAAPVAATASTTPKDGLSKRDKNALKPANGNKTAMAAYVTLLDNRGHKVKVYRQAVRFTPEMAKPDNVYRKKLFKALMQTAEDTFSRLCWDSEYGKEGRL